MPSFLTTTEFAAAIFRPLAFALSASFRANCRKIVVNLLSATVCRFRSPSMYARRLAEGAVPSRCFSPRAVAEQVPVEKIADQLGDVVAALLECEVSRIEQM